MSTISSIYGRPQSQSCVFSAELVASDGKQELIQLRAERTVLTKSCEVAQRDVSRLKSELDIAKGSAAKGEAADAQTTKMEVEHADSLTAHVAKKLAFVEETTKKASEQLELATTQSTANAANLQANSRLLAEISESARQLMAQNTMLRANLSEMSHQLDTKTSLLGQAEVSTRADSITCSACILLVGAGVHLFLRTRTCNYIRSCWAGDADHSEAAAR